MQRSPIRRLLNPYSYGLYFWTFWLVAFMAYVTLEDRIPLDPYIVFPLMWGLLIAIFLVVIGMRVVIIDIINGMNIREKFGFALICAAMFVGPMFLPHELPFSVCLLSMEIPLLLLMAESRGFSRVYAVNLLLIVLYCMEHYDDFAQSAFVILVALLLLIVCMVFDYFCFRSERSSAEVKTDFILVHRLALQFYAGTVLVGLALFWLTPNFGKEPLPAQIRTQILFQSQPAPRPSSDLSLTEIQSIMLQTLLMLMLLILLIAVVNYLKRKWALKRSEEETVLEDVKSKMMSRMRSRKRKEVTLEESGDLREQLFQIYYWFCDRAERTGVKKAPNQTPREFEHAMTNKFVNMEGPLSEITRRFESVRYGDGSVEKSQIEAYRRQVRDFFSEIDS